MRNASKGICKKSVAFLLACLLFLLPPLLLHATAADSTYIKWVDFTVTAKALKDAAAVDIASHAEANKPISWIDLLAALGQKYGGDFSMYRKKDLDTFVAAAKSGGIEGSIQNERLFRYYQEAYGAVLGGMIGHYCEERQDENGITITEQYGLKAFHPLATGYSYAHTDDFGNARSYGYKRRHLGHDMFGSVGTPVIAMESGYVEALGWNQYGGWRIGIRSFDGKRYYYYAHLRKDHPYTDLYEGKIVSAGEVIGYLGMTGYSAKENVNNLKKPHLHVGLELIFDPAQKDGYCQIWVSMYELVNFLADRRVRTYHVNGEATSRIRIIDAEMPD